MVTLKCTGCGRILTDQEPIDEDDPNDVCKQCRSPFEEIEDNEDETEEEEESEEDCLICGNELKKDNFIRWSDQDYDAEIFSEYDSIEICKKCIDDKYPRKIEYKEKIVEKFIDRPVIIESPSTHIIQEPKLDHNRKSKFDL